MKNIERLAIFLIALAIGVWFLSPTIKWYAQPNDEFKAASLKNIEDIRTFATEKARSVVNPVLEAYKKNSNADLTKDNDLILSLAKKSRKEKGMKAPQAWNAQAVLASFSSEAEMFKAAEDYHRTRVMSLKNISRRALKAGLDLRGGMSILLEGKVDSLNAKLGHSASQMEKSEALEADIKILNTRIDQFGVAEAEIRTQGTDQILISLPGEVDPERVNTFLKGKGRLEFVIVDADTSSQVQSRINQSPTSVYKADGSVNKDLFKDVLTDKLELVGYYESDEYGVDNLRAYYVLDYSKMMDASSIMEVETGHDPMSGRPTVNFRLSSEGGDKFYSLTSANKGRPMAVVMDGKIKNIATINDAISTNVQVSGFNQEEAEELAIILQTASLPMELEVVSMENVGSSLGEDTIKKAMSALLIGLGIICVFMIVNYWAAGLVSVLLLLLDIFFMVSTLSAMGFTLTLSSIAGLVLTLGMALDASIIIFEGMKERLKMGKTPQEAARESFSRSFWTLLDANITTLIASIVLSALGSSAVKGFAITLTIGVLASLFTSLLVSKMIFTFNVIDKKGAKLHFGPLFKGGAK